MQGRGLDEAHACLRARCSWPQWGDVGLSPAQAGAVGCRARGSRQVVTAIPSCSRRKDAIGVRVREMQRECGWLWLWGPGLAFGLSGSEGSPPPYFKQPLGRAEGGLHAWSA